MFVHCFLFLCQLNILKMNSVEVFFPGIDESLSEVLIAELSLLNFDPFWQDENGLRAYITAGKLNQPSVQFLAEKYGSDGLALSYTIQATVPDEWDRVLEQDVQPLVIANQITIVNQNAHFQKSTPYTIVMSAQMAFGDGQHPSTELCMEMMLSMNFKKKHVVDAGTGSGILAVLAEKMRAESVLAFDNNPWAVEVTQRTLELNQCRNIQVRHMSVGEQKQLRNQFDIVIANLNYSVFQTEFTNVVQLANSKGQILLSGIMQKDETSVMQMVIQNRLIVVHRAEKQHWIALWLEYAG